MTQFEPSPYDEICKISQELPYFNIKLLPPDLIKSDMDFTIEGKNIRYGLNSRKGIRRKENSRYYSASYSEWIVRILASSRFGNHSINNEYNMT